MERILNNVLIKIETEELKEMYENEEDKFCKELLKKELIRRHKLAKNFFESIGGHEFYYSDDWHIYDHRNSSGGGYPVYRSNEW